MIFFRALFDPEWMRYPCFDIFKIEYFQLCLSQFCTETMGKIVRIKHFLSLKSYTTGCSNKHGNSVTNSISSLLWISIVIPDFKSHNSILSAIVYFMKTVKGCKDVSIMSKQDKQWRWTSLLCLYTVIFLFYKRMQSKHKQTNCKHSRRKSNGAAFFVGITILNQRII